MVTNWKATDPYLSKPRVEQAGSLSAWMPISAARGATTGHDSTVEIWSGSQQEARPLTFSRASLSLLGGADFQWVWNPPA